MAVFISPWSWIVTPYTRFSLPFCNHSEDIPAAPITVKTRPPSSPLEAGLQLRQHSSNVGKPPPLWTHVFIKVKPLRTKFERLSYCSRTCKDANSRQCTICSLLQPPALPFSVAAISLGCGSPYWFSPVDWVCVTTDWSTSPRPLSASHPT